MEFHHIGGMGDTTIGHLRDVDEAVLMYADVDEGSEVGAIRDDTWQFHPFDEIIDGVYSRIKLKLLNLLAWVATRLFQFLHDIREGGNAHLCCHIPFDVDGLTLLLIIN